MAIAEGVLEHVVQDRRAHVEERLHCGPVLAHVLPFVSALVQDLTQGTFRKFGCDRLATSTPGSVVHQRGLVALEVAQQLACVPLMAAAVGYVTQPLALYPATQVLL